MLSKCTVYTLYLHMPPMTSGRLKKTVSGIQKNHAEYCVSGMHLTHKCERPTKCIKNSLINVYDRFLSESFE